MLRRCFPLHRLSSAPCCRRWQSHSVFYWSAALDKDARFGAALGLVGGELLIASISHPQQQLKAWGVSGQISSEIGSGKGFGVCCWAYFWSLRVRVPLFGFVPSITSRFGFTQGSNTVCRT